MLALSPDYYPVLASDLAVERGRRKHLESKKRERGENIRSGEGVKAKGGQMIKSMGGASWISGKGGRGKIRNIIKDKLAQKEMGWGGCRSRKSTSRQHCGLIIHE